jgi:acyl-CoA synthetase (NDP forming)
MTAVQPVIAPRTGLQRLLNPRSLAVFGGHAAAEVVRQCTKIGYTGEVWPVHPTRTELAGKRAFASVTALPGAPDAAFIGVNRHASIGVTAELVAIGAGGAVAYASGFAEAGPEGRALQTQLVQVAGRMPFIGPNCYGLLNHFDNALLWPDQVGGLRVERGVAIITQSGNIGLNITMQRRALPIGYLITLGNQAGLGPADIIHAMLDDPRVTAIGLHLEGLDDPQALAAALARAHRQNIAVVALKTGRSEAGARLAESHTAALASGDAVVDAFFRRVGIMRAASIPVLLETLKLLHIYGRLPGSRIASLSCSGGEAALMADAAADAGVSFMPLSASVRAGIEATVPDMVTVANPLDYHTFAWRDRAALTATFAAMMRGGADLNVLILDFPRPDRCDTADWDIAAAAMAEAARATGARAAVLATLPDAMPEPHAAGLVARGIVPLMGMVEALQAIFAAALPPLEPGFTPLPYATPAEPIQSFSEYAGKSLLAAHGISVPDSIIARGAEAAVQAADALGFPLAVKASGAALAHKTERDGVRLNRTDRISVLRAAEDLLPITGEILIERMIPDGVAELIIGVARDPALGLYLVIGSGGILAEVVGDTSIVLLPAARAQVEAALASLRIARLLNGFRGRRPADIPAAVDAIMAVQQFALAHLATLTELEINPLIVCAAGQGAFAADVLLRMGQSAHV